MNQEHRKVLEEAERLLSYYASKKSPTACSEVADQLRAILNEPTKVASAAVDVEMLLDRYADAHKALDAIGAPPKVNPDGISVARSVAERIELLGEAMSGAKNSNEEAAHDAYENKRWVQDAHSELDRFENPPPRKTSCGTSTITIAGRIANLREAMALKEEKFRSEITKLIDERDRADGVLSRIAHAPYVGSEWANAKPDDHEVVEKAVKTLIADHSTQKSRADALEQRAKAAEAKAAYGPYDCLLMEEVARRRKAESDLSMERAAHAETKSRVPVYKATNSKKGQKE